MPTYNVESYVAYAIESILQQTFDDFEFIIIDDHSSDNTLNIISSYDDSRIILLRNDNHVGVAASINRGILHSRGEYIARMDGDDICVLNRFEKQMSFIQANPKLGIVGSHMSIIDEKGSIICHQKKQIGSENIRIGLFFGRTSLAHPSIIIKKSLLNQYHLRYDSAFYYAEDYDLYCRSSLFFPMDNYPEELIQYRVHPESVSQKHYEHQRQDACMVLFLHLKRIGFDIQKSEYQYHHKFFLKLPEEDDLSLDEKIFWLQHLIDWNKANKYFDLHMFKNICDDIINFSI